MIEFIEECAKYSTSGAWEVLCKGRVEGKEEEGRSYHIWSLFEGSIYGMGAPLHVTHVTARYIHTTSPQGARQ